MSWCQTNELDLREVHGFKGLDTGKINSYFWSFMCTCSCFPCTCWDQNLSACGDISHSHHHSPCTPSCRLQQRRSCWSVGATSSQNEEGGRGRRSKDQQVLDTVNLESTQSSLRKPGTCKTPNTIQFYKNVFVYSINNSGDVLLS